MSSERMFIGVSALLFAASATITIVWCASMLAMGGMPMPGGWTMSMAWMRMSGQTWFGVAATFLGMWVVMMVAMMMPSLVPMLQRYRHATGATNDTRLGLLTLLVGTGYFLVWTVFGIVAFPLGVALAASLKESVVIDSTRSAATTRSSCGSVRTTFCYENFGGNGNIAPKRGSKKRFAETSKWTSRLRK